MNENTRRSLDAWLAEEISSEVALARLILGGIEADNLLRMLASATDPRLLPLAEFAKSRRSDLARLSVLLQKSGLAHEGPASESDFAHLAAAFGRAVAEEPEASVALYSLGDPAILARATSELVEWLIREALIGPASDVLDLGCGFGRVAATLAEKVRSVRCLDISPEMIQRARQRYGHIANVSFETTGGRDLTALPGAAFDLLLAVDSFPYIMQVDPKIAEAHLLNSVRILRPGGAFAILNLSYRNDAALDIADARRWAHSAGLRLGVAGALPFCLWDGRAFVFRVPEWRDKAKGAL